LLMDHLEERVHLPSWEATLQHVLRPLSRLRPDLGDEEELGRLLGRFQTNCVAAGNGLVGLFPTFSLLSHSCIANTRRCAQNGRVRVRAARPLEEGEELTTSYKCPELGSVARRGHFPTTWFFDCTCSRCCSPTELGSHLSSLLCPLQPSNENEKDPSHPGKDTSPCSLTADLPRPSCPGGLLTPSFPTEYNSPWSCNSCSFTMSSCQVMEKQVSLFRHLSLTCLTNLQSVEQLLHHLAKVAPPTHYLALQAKKALVSLIPNTDDIDDNWLKRKVAISEEWLRVIEVVDPGYSPAKAPVIEELAGAKMQLLRRNQEEVGKIQLLLGMKEGMKMVREAAKCRQVGCWDQQS